MGYHLEQKFFNLSGLSVTPIGIIAGTRIDWPRTPILSSAESEHLNCTPEQCFFFFFYNHTTTVNPTVLNPAVYDENTTDRVQ